MTDTPYLLAIDQGTTSSRVIIFDADGKIVMMQQKELTLHYPKKGWVEQDAMPESCEEVQPGEHRLQPHERSNSRHVHAVGGRREGHQGPKPGGLRAVGRADDV